MAGFSVRTSAPYADILCDQRKYYMKLVLDGDLADTISGADISFYSQQRLIWGSDDTERVTLGRQPPQNDILPLVNSQRFPTFNYTLFSIVRDPSPFQLFSLSKRRT